MNRLRARQGILFLFGVFSLISMSSVFGQTDPATNSHWYNRASYNPASITRPGFIYIFSNVRRQWVSVDGAPRVYNLQASGFSGNNNTALGLSLTREEIGLTTAFNPKLQYAHRVYLNQKMDLSLGLSAGFYSRRINASKFQADDVTDEALANTDEKYLEPDADFGAELQSEHFISGLSITHLFLIWKRDSQFLINNHRYAYFFYRNDTEMYKLLAGVQVVNRRNLTYLEASAIVRIKWPTGLQKGPTELFDLGLTLRTVKQITLLTGIHITPDFRLGYTYDFGGKLSVGGSGTHEFVLEYRFPLRQYRDNGYPWYD